MRYPLKTLMVAAIFGASLLPSYGNAMTFQAEPLASGVVVLHFNGKIEHGDFQKAEAFLNASSQQYPGKKVVALNSFGGYVLEGRNMAMMIRQRGLPVLVLGNNQCNSACFMLFAAGNKRTVGRGAIIAVHSATGDNNEDADAMATTVTMSRFLESYGVPSHIIGKVITTEAKNMYVLTEADLRSMQVTYLEDVPKTLPVLDWLLSLPAPVKTATVAPVAPKPVPTPVVAAPLFPQVKPEGSPDIEGRVTGVKRIDEIEVAAKWIKIHGIIDRARGPDEIQHAQALARYLRTTKNHVVCYRKVADTYRCYSNGQDIAQLALRDRMVELAPNAPTEYRALMTRH